MTVIIRKTGTRGTVLTATGLLAAPYLEFIGGAALLYIALHLLIDHGTDEDGGVRPATLGAANLTVSCR